MSKAIHIHVPNAREIRKTAWLSEQMSKEVMRSGPTPLVTKELKLTDHVSSQLYQARATAGIGVLLSPTFSKKTRGQSILAFCPSSPLSSRYTCTLCAKLILQFYADFF